MTMCHTHQVVFAAEARCPLCVEGQNRARRHDDWPTLRGAAEALDAARGAGLVGFTDPPRAHIHYFKNVAKLLHVDVYRVLALFSVTDPCLQHAVKKLLVAGGRGGGKDISRDIQEAIDTLKRWQEMRTEEATS